jgi:hypothetical protein
MIQVRRSELFSLSLKKFEVEFSCILLPEPIVDTIVRSTSQIIARIKAAKHSEYLAAFLEASEIVQSLTCSKQGLFRGILAKVGKPRVR